MNYSQMTLAEIQRVVRNDWKNIYFGAVPYLSAMGHIVDGMYGLDTWESIVIYFLSNATTWRGQVAREVKAELKKRYSTHNIGPVAL